MREKVDLQNQYEQQMAVLEQQHSKQLKDADRDKKRILRDFDSLKQQLLQKEQGVKSEIERVWQDWEERCASLERDKQNTEFRLQEAEVKVKELQKGSLQHKKEARELRDLCDQAKQELKVVQNMYEQELAKKEQEI